eukprot:EG_transcript_6573
MTSPGYPARHIAPVLPKGRRGFKAAAPTPPVFDVDPAAPCVPRVGAVEGRPPPPPRGPPRPLAEDTAAHSLPPPSRRWGCPTLTVAAPLPKPQAASSGPPHPCAAELPAAEGGRTVNDPYSFDGPQTWASSSLPPTPLATPAAGHRFQPLALEEMAAQVPAGVVARFSEPIPLFPAAEPSHGTPLARRPHEVQRSPHIVRSPQDERPAAIAPPVPGCSGVLRSSGSSSSAHSNPHTLLGLSVPDSDPRPPGASPSPSPFPGPVPSPGRPSRPLLIILCDEEFHSVGLR